MIPAFLTSVICSLFDRGHSSLYISRHLQQKYAFRITRRGLRSFRQRKTTKRSQVDSKLCVLYKDYISCLYKRQPSTTAREVQSRLKDCFGVCISISTVRRWRAELGWKCKTVRYCQMISKANYQKRLNFSMEMLRNRETFSNVIFTDETSVEMNSSGSVFFYQEGATTDMVPRQAPKPKHAYKVCF